MIDAKEKYGRIHRDISVDNIILVRKKKGERRTGILVDWELSTKINEEGEVEDNDKPVSREILASLDLF